ncbi:hypothetical protein WP12_09290 [Sphingomonas sp. SRS2]|nr:hypothetical protein WP12_09290 [Sphingomonas sp. SRS2]
MVANGTITQRRLAQFWSNFLIHGSMALGFAMSRFWSRILIMLPVEMCPNFHQALDHRRVRLLLDQIGQGIENRSTQFSKHRAASDHSIVRALTKE